MFLVIKRYNKYLYPMGTYGGYDGWKSSWCDFARSLLSLPGCHPYPKVIQTHKMFICDLDKDLKWGWWADDFWFS